MDGGMKAAAPITQRDVDEASYMNLEAARGG